MTEENPRVFPFNSKIVESNKDEYAKVISLSGAEAERASLASSTVCRKWYGQDFANLVHGALRTPPRILLLEEVRDPAVGSSVIESARRCRLNKTSCKDSAK